MADAPWFKFWTENFLAGVADLNPEQRGVYITLLALMYDREGPLAYDPQSLAARCNMTTRAFNRILAQLIEIPGKIERRGDMLGNKRALAELAQRRTKSGKARQAALTRWRNAREPELDLDQPPARAHARGGKKLAEKLPEKLREKPPVKNREMAENRQSAPENASGLAGARVRGLRDNTHPTPESEPPVRAHARPREEPPQEPKPSRLDDSDLKALFDAVCDAAGFRPVAPDQINRAFAEIERWRADGWDFDLDVIPIIDGIMAKASPDDRTRTLGRFRQHIAHAHARRIAQLKTGIKPAPPPEKIDPIFLFDGEPPEVEPFRRDLHDAVGEWGYTRYLHQVRFRPLGPEEMGDDERRPLEAKGEFLGKRYLTDQRQRIIGIVKRHGWTDLW